MRLLSTLILVFSITAGCRADDGPSADTRVLDDMERLAIEGLVGSWRTSPV